MGVLGLVCSNMWVCRLAERVQRAAEAAANVQPEGGGGAAPAAFATYEAKAHSGRVQNDNPFDELLVRFFFQLLFVL